MIQNTFARHEKKYMLDVRQYDALRAALADYMREDSYGMHTICNIYFDTDDYRLIRASLDKPVYKEKLRLRSYGVPEAQDTVYLELKKKYRGIVYKRRAPLPLDQARRYFASGKTPELSCQILREIDWFLNFYHPVPKVYLAYDRVALYGIEQKDLRVTFDRGIRWRSESLDLGLGDWGAPLIGPRQVLMELKIPDAMPLWLCHLLSSLKIYPATFSKYGVCYQRHLSGAAKGGIICA